MWFKYVGECPRPFANDKPGFSDSSPHLQLIMNDCLLVTLVQSSQDCRTASTMHALELSPDPENIHVV